MKRLGRTPRTRQPIRSLYGRRFGKLVPVAYNAGKWLCQCDCGNKVHRETSKLTGGHTKSCGCEVRGLKRPGRYGGLCSCGDHAFAVLTRGYVVYVSPEDAYMLLGRPWNAHKERRGTWKVIGSHRRKLHREIMGASQGEVVDHRNGNAFDNRRSNLRVCEQAQNTLNQRRRRNKMHSIYKGVTRTTTGIVPWRAAICIGGTRFHLGTFHNERDAAVAYDTAALRLHGEFARTNASLGLLSSSG